MRRRLPATLLVALVLGLFVAGALWRATHPDQATTTPNEEQQIEARQAGYYLCLNLPLLTESERRALVRAKLPHANFEWALRGCDEGQKR